MAESMKGLHRSHRCTEVSNSNIGQQITVMGWVQKRRNLGSLIFIDLRDRSGLLQIVFDEPKVGSEGFAKAESLRSEFVIAVTGTVEKRTAAVNENLKTGDIEVIAESIRILSESETPPFPIEENSQTKEDMRLRYRYLDLRRPDIQRNMMMKSKVAMLLRNFMDREGFLEIETPILTKSTPEGARDYLVPSRVHPGSFYALPQSPQIFKQLLMVGGTDRYMQIVKCFRDEDLRADRQPEFTQIDLEMSFVDMDDVIEIQEGFLKKVFKDLMNIDIKTPFPRLTWDEAMERYGSDKPDTRFGFELKKLNDLVSSCDFKVFTDALAAGGDVRGICIDGGSEKFSRKDIDKLTDLTKSYGAKGLVWIRVLDGEFNSSVNKFFSQEQLSDIAKVFNAKAGDLIFIVSDRPKVVFDSLGFLRREVAKRMGLLDDNIYNLLWVVDFPLFEKDDETGELKAMHHPFTHPKEEDIPMLDTDPAAVRADAYDMVINGVEVGGGSIRIHDAKLQAKMFEILGFTPEKAEAQFGFLMNAFKYGAPPHGGLAYGLDRWVSLFAGLDSIRDCIAFPKNNSGRDVMLDAPSEIDQTQLDELNLIVDIKKNK